jgi:hypothetical protein
MIQNCLQCNTNTQIDHQVEAVDFVCPYCGAHHRKDEKGYTSVLKTYPKLMFVSGLELGKKGVIDGDLWEIGARSKKVATSGFIYEWDEFTLYNDKGDVRFLSVTEGHWIMAKEVPLKYYMTAGAIQHKGFSHKCYDRHAFRTKSAEGIFDHPIADKTDTAYFVHDNEAIIYEKEDDKTTYMFEAWHVSQEEVEEAFPDVALPYQYNVGMLQPFWFDLERLISYAAATAGIIIVLQIALQLLYPSRTVLEGNLWVGDTENPAYVTPSFDVKGIVTPLSVEMFAPVNNSWVAAELCLVDEKTKEEVYTTGEVSYYSGWDDGEWQEGSTTQTFSICGVKPGRYHFSVRTFKDASIGNSSQLSMQVTARKPQGRNLMFALGFLFLLVLIAWMVKANWEQQKWSNTNSDEA